MLDEPFAALDVYLRDKIQMEILQLLENYTGQIIMVSHSRDEIYRFSEELLILDEGRVLEQGATRAVFDHPRRRRTAVLTGCKNISSAERIDDHTVYLSGWNITLHTQQVLPEVLRYVGYRAHDFRPRWAEDEPLPACGVVPVDLYRQADLLFEKNFYIRPNRADFDRDDLITWFLQRDDWARLEERGLPQELLLDENKLLLLE